MDASGNVTVTSPGRDDLSIFITPTTGAFGGTFADTAISKLLILFNGETLQTNNFGAGLFLGTNASGFVTMVPSP